MDTYVLGIILTIQIETGPTVYTLIYTIGDAISVEPWGHSSLLPDLQFQMCILKAKASRSNNEQKLKQQ